MYCLYFYTVQTFISVQIGVQIGEQIGVQIGVQIVVQIGLQIGVQIGVQINLFSQLCFLSSLTPMPSSGQLFSIQLI